MSISAEKQKIIEAKGNILVTANPGTGKTFLLAAKFVSLIKSGIKPQDLLCLTFTSKAKQEMEERIVKFLAEEKLKIDLSKLNIHTFHSFALDNIETQEISSTNMLRYIVFEYIRSKELLNYGDEYLLETIVPSIESNISYLKNYGILPADIVCDAVKPFLEETKSYTVADLERYLKAFVEIYTQYESSKRDGTCDYADMLLSFRDKRDVRQYEFVLVDELQDVNRIEAEIALKVAKHFFAVGDKKQAIFGFQGGSIENFKLFADSTHFVLSENRRSTQMILDFAKQQYLAGTTDTTQSEELVSLKNADGTIGERVKVIESEKKEIPKVLAQLVKKYSSLGKVAVIARTNSQVALFSKLFTDYGIEHSSTSVQSARDARSHIIIFLKGLLSQDVQDVKHALFTPFFPLSIQSAFELTKNVKVTLTDITTACPSFASMRDSLKTIQDLERLFDSHILPISAQYSKSYFLASVQLHNLVVEAINAVASKNLLDVLSYISASDQDVDEAMLEKNIVITTVHKSKGREYDYAIYVPSESRNKQDFTRSIVLATLKSKGLNALVEVEEEALRIDFVAYTRARKELFIVSDDSVNYLNDFSELVTLEKTTFAIESSQEKYKRAFSLFVAGNDSEAKLLLSSSSEWLLPHIVNHFASVETVSFTTLREDAYEYLLQNVLRLSSFSTALTLGNQIHGWAEKLLKEGTIGTEDIAQNVLAIHNMLLSRGYTVYASEETVKVPLMDLVGVNSPLLFKGKIDAIYVKGAEYFIVDWKSDKNTDNGGKHRQQLACYRKALALKLEIPLESIKVGIGFVALRKTVNDGSIEYFFDEKQPATSAFETFKKKLQAFLNWRENPQGFLEEVFATEQEDYLWRALREINDN